MKIPRWVKCERTKGLAVRTVAFIIVFAVSLWLFNKGELYNGGIFKGIDLNSDTSSLSRGVNLTE